MIIPKTIHRSNLRSEDDYFCIESNSGTNKIISNKIVLYWNSLPIEMKSRPNITGFKNKLKTHLFSIAYGK